MSIRVIDHHEDPGIGGGMILMITDGGAHPHQKWAESSAQSLFPISPMMPMERRMEAQKLQAKIALALLPHHKSMQDHERKMLFRNGYEHLASPIAHAEQMAADALARVIAAAEGSPWEALFKEEATIERIRFCLASHFVSSVHGEREWHCHRNEKCSRSQDWLVKSREGHPETFAKE